MKKFNVFMIFLVMILAVSAVSAADLEDSSDADVLAVENDAIDEVVSDAVGDVQATDDADVVAADEGNNFTSLQTIINEEGRNNITLEKDYTRVADDQDIEINKDFTIDGQGKYKLDGNKLGRIFSVTKGILTLNNVTICNGLSNNNYGNNEYGGAIYIGTDASLVAENVAFINNNASVSGGAIFSDGNLTIKAGTTFVNNTAIHGGAIFMQYNTTQLDVTGATFTNNTAENEGGAIATVSDKVNIKESSFIENTANEAGAIKFTGKEVTISSTDFKRNKAKMRQGGAILIMGTSLTVNENCKFTDNTAENRGGAIYASADNGLVIKDSEFTNNVANDQGGAIYAHDTKDKLVISDCEFAKNLAVNFGGAIFTSSNNAEINNVVLKNNTVTDGSGGAIYSTNSTFDIKESELSNNTATGYNGGAVFFVATQNDKTLTISDNTKFINNKADKTGGAILLNDGKATIAATFTGNNATVNGSAVYIRADGNASIKDSTFKDNGGDAEYAIYNLGTLALENNNIADKIYSETEIIKPGSNVTIDPIDNVTYGEPVVVYYTITNNTNNVTVKIDYFSGEMQLALDNANYTIDSDKVTIYNLTANNYRIDIFNNENNNFAGNSSYALFKVKPTSSVTIDPIADAAYGSPVVVNYAIENRSSNVTVSVCYNDGGLPPEVDGAVVDIANNTVTVTNLTTGKYIILIFNNEDDNVGLSDGYAFFNVTKAEPSLQFDAKVNEYGIIVIEAILNKDATGNVTFILTNETGDVVAENTYYVINGTATFGEIAKYANGKYNYTAIYNGDSNYKNITKDSETPVVVSKNYTTPTTELVNVTGGEVDFIVDLGVNATGNVTVVYLSGYEENVTISGGKVKFHQIFIEEQGNLTVVLDYAGDAKYYGFYQYYIDFFIKYDSNLTVNAKVNEFGYIVIEATVNKTATGTITFVIKTNVTDDYDGDIVFNVTEDVVNGAACFGEIYQYAKGNYSYEVSYSGDEIFEDSEYAVGEDLVITKDYITVPEPVVNANEAEITITFPANATGNITVFYSSGANETIAANGTVVLDEIFDNGNQWILVTYPGDDKYYGFNVNKTFFVKTSSFIKVGNVNVVYLNNGKVTVTLTDNNDGKGNNPIANAEIVITLNGKTYKGTTNDKGVATVSIAANLVPKAYTATVSYAGTNTTVGDKETFKFTVKKATPKLTAKKKTFKAKTKTKKYTIILKNNKNKVMKKVKVYLKVKGKTYTAKTNAKGKATFKIKNLKKKGTYKAKVTFKATKYFNKVTKTVKIKVKR